ncbi:MAG: hypothetical protein ACXWL2_04290 [Candidatus Chromulinivorax sp.]
MMKKYLLVIILGIQAFLIKSSQDTGWSSFLSPFDGVRVEQNEGWNPFNSQFGGLDENQIFGDQIVQENNSLSSNENLDVINPIDKEDRKKDKKIRTEELKLMKREDKNANPVTQEIIPVLEEPVVSSNENLSNDELPEILEQKSEEVKTQEPKVEQQKKDLLKKNKKKKRTNNNDSDDLAFLNEIIEQNKLHLEEKNKIIADQNTSINEALKLYYHSKAIPVQSKVKNAVVKHINALGKKLTDFEKDIIKDGLEYDVYFENFHHQRRGIIDYVYIENYLNALCAFAAASLVDIKYNQNLVKNNLTDVGLGNYNFQETLLVTLNESSYAIRYNLQLARQINIVGLDLLDQMFENIIKLQEAVVQYANFSFLQIAKKNLAQIKELQNIFQ